MLDSSGDAANSVKKESTSGGESSRSESKPSSAVHRSSTTSVASTSSSGYGSEASKNANLTYAVPSNVSYCPNVPHANSTLSSSAIPVVPPRAVKHVDRMSYPLMNIPGHHLTAASSLWSFPPPPIYFPAGPRAFARPGSRPPFLFSFPQVHMQQNIPMQFHVPPPSMSMQIPMSHSSKDKKYSHPSEDQNHRHHNRNPKRDEPSLDERDKSKRHYSNFRPHSGDRLRPESRSGFSNGDKHRISHRSSDVTEKSSSRPAVDESKPGFSRSKERNEDYRKGRTDGKSSVKPDADAKRQSRKDPIEKKAVTVVAAAKTAEQKTTTDRCDTEELLTREISWIRCSPADPYYTVAHHAPNSVNGSEKLKDLQRRFEHELSERSSRVTAAKPPFRFPPRKAKLHPPKHQSDSSSCSSDEADDDEDDTAFEELQRKKTHPWRLHDELWYNDVGEMNDGPVCRCSAKARRTGIRHGIYPGEESLKSCDINSNNSERLYHYRLKISPLTNYTSKFPTVIWHDNHEFIFEGFSILAHSPILNYPPCKLIRFNIEYTITLQEEKFPTNFTVKDIDMITKYIFKEVLELVDIDWKAHNDNEGCPRFHLFPRFARLVEEDGKELLSANMILQYLLSSSVPLISEDSLSAISEMTETEWINFARDVKGMIVTYPGMKPCSVRVDQIDRESDEGSGKSKPDDGYPIIVHFGIRPPQLSYAGNPKYQKAWRDYVKFRHLLANKPKVSFADRQTLLQKEEKLQEMRMKSDLKRDVTVIISSKGFYRTGLFCDVIQHALLIPVVICHLRFHQSLVCLESILDYSFKDRYILQLALTHPSYRENFGTNPDHARNALTNCGIRQPYYGDRRVHFMNTRKRGINMLINIMSRFGCPEETASNINHNERLEFLGDAVVEFLSSIHLYFMFPDLEEGGLATYRAAIVQNQHLAVLAKKLRLEEFMLYAHGSDLCHDLELRHAMANCFEALMGSLFLDGDISVADKVFSNTLFGDEPGLLETWVNYPKHPIQLQDAEGDRHYVKDVPRLRELLEFEELTGIEFSHIRLLARAFTHRSVGFNNLTLGSNQRMEFLGDTVLQLVASEYLYKFFPEHHEGHLSLLRSSLVNNKTQAVVCDDLGMTQFAVYNYAKGELKTKDRADLLEAFLGALYVDKGLEFCRTFCEVCFFPRLEDFIMNQDWNDPKSKLQQCCLTLRSIDGGEPDIPVYKVIESLGPTNTRVYKVAVYFRDQRLATGKGHSIQEAEMDAAANALNAAKGLFPQLSHQKRVIERSLKQQEPAVKRMKRSLSESESSSASPSKQ